MVVVDGTGLPLGNHLHSASPSEVKLVEAMLKAIRVGRRHGAGRPRQKPCRLIADRGYDSDPLREQLAARGIELIAPHRKNRRKLPTQDGRALRRYKRRWIMERTFAWLGNFRRLVVRYERSLTVYQGFFHPEFANLAPRRSTQRGLVRDRPKTAKRVVNRLAFLLQPTLDVLVTGCIIQFHHGSRIRLAQAHPESGEI